MKSRIARTQQLTKTVKATIAKKQRQDFEKSRSAVAKILKYHQRVKKISIDELVKELDKGGKGKITEKELTSFLESADKVIKVQALELPPEAEEAKVEEAAPKEEAATTEDATSKA